MRRLVGAVFAASLFWAGCEGGMEREPEPLDSGENIGPGEEERTVLPEEQDSFGDEDSELGNEPEELDVGEEVDEIDVPGEAEEPTDGL